MNLEVVLNGESSAARRRGQGQSERTLCRMSRLQSIEELSVGGSIHYLPSAEIREEIVSASFHGFE